MRRRTEAKRNAILKVAEELFRKKGYQNTSMSEITAKVGGSKATIYGYFKSKKLLFEAVMNGASFEKFDLAAYQQESGNDIQERFASDSPVPIVPIENYQQMALVLSEMLNSQDDIRTTLYRFSGHFMQTVCQPQFLEIYRLAVEGSGRTKIGKHFFEKGYAHIIGDIKRCFQARMDKGELRPVDADTVALHFISVVRGPIFERYLFGYGSLPKMEFRKRIRQSVDAFLKIYGTS